MIYDQDPLDPESPYLLEQLLDACDGATAGAAAFAWASRAGISLFLQDPMFVNFSRTGTFELIVGIDAITDPAALDALAEAEASLPRFSASVFFHQRPFTIFHPKHAWFASQTGGTVITGSGNLTAGGLRANWETFARDAISASTLVDVRRQWMDWRIRNARFLRPLADPAVAARAMENTRRDFRRAAEPVDVAIELGEHDAPANAEVLVAEIPKSGNRWAQANFDLENYERFFGARAGTQRRVLLRSVDMAGVIGEVESRPSVEVKSQNYRFELAAAAGLAYPVNGRPIGLFVRLPTGVIIYHLSMPGQPHYGKVETILGAHWDGPARQVRRVRMTVADLKQYWPDAPVLE